MPSVKIDLKRAVTGYVVYRIDICRKHIDALESQVPGSDNMKMRYALGDKIDEKNFLQSLLPIPVNCPPGLKPLLEKEIEFLTIHIDNMVKNLGSEQNPWCTTRNIEKAVAHRKILSEYIL